MYVIYSSNIIILYYYYYYLYGQLIQRNWSETDYSRYGTNCTGWYLTDWLGPHIRNIRRLQDLYVQYPAYDCQIVTLQPAGLESIWKEKQSLYYYIVVLLLKKYITIYKTINIISQYLFYYFQSLYIYIYVCVNILVR